MYIYIYIKGEGPPVVFSIAPDTFVYPLYTHSFSTP